MKFKTQLLITFLAVILLPLIMTGAAFLALGVGVAHSTDKGMGIEDNQYSTIADTLAAFSNRSTELYDEIRAIAKTDPSRLENRDYLDALNVRAHGTAAYLVVRRDEELYYTGNAKASELIFERLPRYGAERADRDAGYYYSDMQKLVKQVDFENEAGQQVSVFLITRVNSVISKSLIEYMFLAIVVILVVTAFVLVYWIRETTLEPVNRLNVAMQQIAAGNFDYMLNIENKDDTQGEIAELYRNYEDMRLRLKESTEEKIENEKQNRELISNISHDLKTPITSIKGYVEGIMDGVADTPEKMDKYIRIIYTKANDMDRLINELTYYSRIDSHRIPYSFQRINLAEFFQDCVEDVGLDLESKNIKLHYSNLVDPATRIIADPEQMSKVINNIIGNSVKYMDKPEGEIEIRILDELDSVRIEIEDNGRGIAAKDLGNIFERFYRTDASRNSARGGSGIGLSIVKRIIVDHGGYIWATSKEGEGTCIHFVIRKYREVQDYE